MNNIQLITTNHVLQITRVSRVTLWRMIKDGNFPTPTKMNGRGKNYFLLSDVETWISNKFSSNKA